MENALLLDRSRYHQAFFKFVHFEKLKQFYRQLLRTGKPKGGHIKHKNLPDVPKPVEPGLKGDATLRSGKYDRKLSNDKRGVDWVLSRTERRNLCQREFFSRVAKIGERQDDDFSTIKSFIGLMVSLMVKFIYFTLVMLGMIILVPPLPTSSSPIVCYTNLNYFNTFDTTNDAITKSSSFICLLPFVSNYNTTILQTILKLILRQASK